MFRIGLDYLNVATIALNQVLISKYKKAPYGPGAMMELVLLIRQYLNYFEQWISLQTQLESH